MKIQHEMLHMSAYFAQMVNYVFCNVQIKLTWIKHESSRVVQRKLP